MRKKETAIDPATGVESETAQQVVRDAAPPKVATITVNWNGLADTLACLESLRAQDYPNNHVIVVDNGSTDGSADALRKQCDTISLIETGSNLGFTGGNNAGIQSALRQDFDYIYLLNNDTIVEPDSLRELVRAAEAQPEYGILSPVMHYHDRRDEIWFGGATLNLRRGRADHDPARNPARTDPPYEVPWTTGCAMLVRTDLMRRLGGFDDRFFLIWEDVDISLRAVAAGSKIGIVPSAHIYHKVSRSFASMSSTMRYYLVRNNLLFARLHAKEAYPRAVCDVIATRLLESLGYFRLIRGQRDTPVYPLGATLRGIRDHFLQRYGAIGSWQRSRQNQDLAVHPSFPQSPASAPSGRRVSGARSQEETEPSTTETAAK